MKTDSKLIEKYDVPVPRYTSYPTVPYWDTPLTPPQWTQELQKAYTKPDTTWALYLHIPFCETLCTFCGCNNMITKDHKREDGYIKTLHNEWETYLKNVPEIENRPLEEVHLGGGTPTFLSATHLKELLMPIFERCTISSQGFEASIEVDPRRTSFEQIEVLREMKFTRLSMGVQDFDPEVQRLVNRIQPLEITEKLTQHARKLGYESVNFDLIYGLPKQTLASMEATIGETIRLKPDRIALYSFAHVPWIKPAQRLFTDEDLPKGNDKRALYELGREKLMLAGYVEIGMDHFALPTDSFHQAFLEKKLHRNFMGYTSRRTQVLLGLGVSSISETPTCFHQNEKALPVYERLIQQGGLATLRGHLLDDEDRRRREQILELMTQWQTTLEAAQLDDALRFLKPMFEDGLVKLEGAALQITEKGKPFLRNACVFFDVRLRRKSPQAKIFSQAI